jgi:hypothetical protein
VRGGLRHQRHRVERRGRPQYRPDIVWIGDLVEHDDRAARVAVDHVAEMQLVEREAFEHEALVRRIARDEPAEVGDLGVFERKVRLAARRRARQFPRAWPTACGARARGC